MADGFSFRMMITVFDNDFMAKHGELMVKIIVVSNSGCETVESWLNMVYNDCR